MPVRWLDSGQITELVSIRFSLVLCSWLPTSFFQLTFFLFSTFLTSHYLLFYVLWLHFILKAVLGVYSFNSLRSRLKKETLLFDFDLCESRGRVASGGTSELRNSLQYLSLRRFFCSIQFSRGQNAVEFLRCTETLAAQASDNVPWGLSIPVAMSTMSLLHAVNNPVTLSFWRPSRWRVDLWNVSSCCVEFWLFRTTDQGATRTRDRSGKKSPRDKPVVLN